MSPQAGGLTTGYSGPTAAATAAFETLILAPCRS